MIAYINASPLIYLAKLGLLDLLPRYFSHIITAKAVQDEVLARSDVFEYATLNQAFTQWILTKPPATDRTLYASLLNVGLYHGEIELILIPRQALVSPESLEDPSNLPPKHTYIILDDGGARALAKTLGMKVTGTLGLLLRFVHQKLLPKADAIHHLNYLTFHTDFRIAADVYAQVLAALESI